MDWNQALKLCSLSESRVARALYKRAKAGRTLTSTQINWIYTYANRVAERIEDKVVKISPAPIFPLSVDDFGSKHTLVRKGDWIVEILVDRVVGKVDQGSNTLIIFPNPVISGSAVRSAIGHGRGRERTGVRDAELV